MHSASKSKLMLAALVAGAVLAACGSDEDDGGEGAPQAAAKPARLAIELSGSARRPSFSVPPSVKGGSVAIEFTNSAKGEHSAQLLRAEAGHTPREALAAANAWGEKGRALPDWAILAGGFGDVESGETRSATRELVPGRYVVADLDTGASAEFEVSGRAGGGDAAEAGATITASDYAFRAEGLKAGRGHVLFDNAGDEPHFVAAVGLRPGATIAEAKRFFETEKGRPPIDDRRGFTTAVIEGGDRQAVELDLEAGSYVLLCFVPDRKGGPPHVAKGMISEAVVSE